MPPRAACRALLHVKVLDIMHSPCAYNRARSRAVARGEGELRMKLCEITVSRTITAPAADVFDVWLDSNTPGGPWFGADRVILDPTDDGLFYHAIGHEGRNWAH